MLLSAEILHWKSNPDVVLVPMARLSARTTTSTLGEVMVQAGLAQVEEGRSGFR